MWHGRYRRQDKYCTEWEGMHKEDKFLQEACEAGIPLYLGA